VFGLLKLTRTTPVPSVLCGPRHRSDLAIDSDHISGN